jgi:hypothetical protein
MRRQEAAGATIAAADNSTYARAHAAFFHSGRAGGTSATRVGEQLSTLCRPPDYADQGPQGRLGGGDRCNGVGIITMPREKRRVHQEADSGPV